MHIQVTTYYLEMFEQPELADVESLSLVRSLVINPTLNRYFYANVGVDWLWTGRLPWTEANWLEVLDRPGVETWIAYVDGSPAGYVELDGTVEGAVEICYFGLLPAFVGKGLGRAFLAKSLDAAWSIVGTDRVWLKTCSLDHPRALQNYLDVGFMIERTTNEPEYVPDEPLEPWPGSGRLPLTTGHDHPLAESPPDGG